MSPGVGSDVEALCAKCGDVWHVVFAKDGDKIAKVQCKQCGGYHRYKSPRSATPAERQGRTPSNPRPERAPVERFEKAAVEADMSKPVRPYRASEAYEVADRIEHPTFGTGTVEIVESGKVTVFFATGRKVLAAAKIVNPVQLTKPPRFDHSGLTPGGKPLPDR